MGGSLSRDTHGVAGECVGGLHMAVACAKPWRLWRLFGAEALGSSVQDRQQYDQMIKDTTALRLGTANAATMLQRFRP